MGASGREGEAFKGIRELAERLLLSVDGFRGDSAEEIEQLNLEIVGFFDILERSRNMCNTQLDAVELDSIIDSVHRRVREKAKATGLRYRKGNPPRVVSAAMATKQLPQSPPQQQEDGAESGSRESIPKVQFIGDIAVRGSEEKAHEKMLHMLELSGCSISSEIAELVVGSIERQYPQEVAMEKIEHIVDFTKEIGRDVAGRYFSVIGNSKAVEALTNERVLHTANFVRQIGEDAAWDYFFAIGNSKAVEALTNERVLHTASFVRQIGEDAAWKYFSAIGNTKAVEALTDERVMEFAKEIGGDAALDYFFAIGKTKAVEALTNERVLHTASFVRQIGRDAASGYFSAIGDTKAVEALTSEALIEFCINQHVNSAYAFFGLGKIISFSDSHHLCGEKWSFDKDPLVAMLNPGKPIRGNVSYNAAIQSISKLAENLSAAENRIRIKVDRAAVDSLNEVVRRTGGSTVYVSFASGLVASKEDFVVLLSGRRGDIDKMIVERVNSHFGNAPFLPSTVEGWGGIEMLRLVWENKNYFNEKENLLAAIHSPVPVNKDAVHSALPRFDTPYSKIYNLLQPSGKKAGHMPHEQLSKILYDCNEMVGLLFKQPRAAISIKDEFGGLAQNAGSGMRRKLDAIWKRYEPDRKTDFLNLRDFARNLKELEKEFNSMKSADKTRYDQIFYHYGRIINVIESEFAGKYFAEKLEGKRAQDLLSANEMLNLIYQYIIDPDFNNAVSPGRRMLFEQLAKTIYEDSKAIGTTVPSDGILTVKSWNRDLSDIFGGRYSGDCTAPPNTGEYSGSNFDKNFGYIEDPGTNILNFYWQKEPGQKPEPIGRAYCFAVETRDGPAVLVDSIEFLASFPAGPSVEGIVGGLLLQDYADNLGVPVLIDANARVSNRSWVTSAIQSSGLSRGAVSMSKIGNEVYMEHIHTQEVYKAAPRAR